jgi:hypothetical protein
MNPVSDLSVDVMDDEIIVWGRPGRTILLRKLSGKSGVTFYLWCTGCRIPLHACLFTGRLALGSRCGEANCENESKDRHKTFHGASPSILLRVEADIWQKRFRFKYQASSAGARRCCKCR